MRRLLRLLLLGAVLLAVWGCAPRAMLHGKAVDQTGRVMRELAIRATPVNAPASAGRYEVETDWYGKFRFGRLTPHRDYALLPQLEKWSDAPQYTVNLGAEEQLRLFDQSGYTSGNPLVVTAPAAGADLALPESLIIKPVKTTLRGVVVDGAGAPLRDLTIVAHQKNPLRGYERVSATSDRNGRFEFTSLFPDAEYALLPVPPKDGAAPVWLVRYEPTGIKAMFDQGGWAAEPRVVVRSGRLLQQTSLDKPLVVQPYLAGVDGLLVDNEGRPLPGKKLLARRQEPGKGEETLAASTDAQGRFVLDKLGPQTTYAFFLEDDATNALAYLRTPDVTEKTRSRLVLVVGFGVTPDGLVTDLKTGLQWAPDPGMAVDWAQAERYAADLVAGGQEDWRLPTLAELKTLFRAGFGVQYRLLPPLRVSGCCVWSADKQAGGAYWCLMATTGFATADAAKNSYNNHVLAVRTVR